MLNCRHVARLVSQSMDLKLSWRQRLAMRVHLWYCIWCRRYAAQLRFLRRAAQELPAEDPNAPSHALAPEAKENIRTRLREAVRRDGALGE